ncbi:hypothetical protein BGZ75_010147 [Mortierella antarctica]|nr:hypothetical protein BGZ67_005938 [Mortierella alpina]KAF9988014.1 hypothetical protein BGZ75_010147 [Mortierella antarctica]
MATSIALPIESASSTLTKDFATIETTPKETAPAHSRAASDESSVMDDPLATTASVPSSDDGHDDSTDSVTDFSDHTDHSRDHSVDDKQNTLPFSQESDRPSTPLPQQQQQQESLALAEPSQERRPMSFAEGEERPRSFAEGEQPENKTLSRPLSRQELRRKSSFFNSKDIAVSDQRYSPATYDSLRPVADPRFKSRFQSVLSQWKARASG